MNRRGWGVWALLSAVGVVLVALPDDDRRLFSLSRTHGPAALDAAGGALVLLAWALLWAGLWRRRHALPVRAWLLAAAGAGAGLAVLVWAVRGDHGAWWLLGVALLAGVQLAAAVAVSGDRQRA